MKATLLAFFIALAIFLMPGTGFGAGAGTKIVTRIDTVNAVMKGGTMTIRVEGMASTPSLLGRGGALVRRGQGPNKDGLLEYELVFNPPQKNYTGDALKLVKTTLKVSSVPPGTKGVRIYAEYNEMNGMLPESKQTPAVTKKETFLKTEEPVAAKKEKRAAKKEELAAQKTEREKTSQWWNPFHRKPVSAQVNATPPISKKPEVALKKKAPVVKKEEPIVTKKEKPAPKREELASKKPEVTVKEEKKKRGWNLNPFHRKPATAEISAPPATRKETPVLKKKELVVKTEKPAPKVEEPPLKKEKKKRGWNLNPFHRKPAASETIATPAPPEPALKKRPAIREEESAAIRKENPISKKEEAALVKKEEAAPKKEKKKRGWNLNPFHRKSAASETNAMTPEPKKKEPVVTREKPALKKEETAPPKKKKSQWWNPFHHKADASQTGDDSPR